MSQKESTFYTQNHKAEYKNKITVAEKANGEVQIKEVSTRSDILEGLPETVIKAFIDTYDTGIANKLRMVSPYAK